jgi:hypothetical protein
VWRFGAFAVSALLLLGPLFLALAWKCLRTALAKWRVLRRDLTWWHWLWFFLLASGFVLRVRDANTAKQSPVDGAALYRMAMVGVTALVLVWRQLRRSTRWMGLVFQGLVGALTLFSLVCASSSVWSLNPPWTLYKSIEYLVDMMLLAAILYAIRSIQEYETLLNWNWVLTGLLIASAWVGAVIWPEEGLYGSYNGGTLGMRLEGVLPGQGSNRLGDLGAILGVVCIARLFPFAKQKYDRFWYALVLLFGVATIVLSQTRSALIGLVLGTLLILAFTGRLTGGVLIAGSLVALVLLSGAGSVLLEFLQRGQSKEEMISLSDRLKWWSVGWQLLSQHPLTGLGAFAAGPFGVFEKLGMNNVGPLHSDYVETLVGTSFWGLLPLLLALFGCWRYLVLEARDASATLPDRQLAMEATAVLAVITVRSVFMTFIVMHPPLNFTVLLGLAEISRRRRRRGRQTLQPDAKAAA